MTTNAPLIISEIDGYQIIPNNEIIFCEADSNYTIIHKKDGQKILVSKTLKYIQGQLNNESFARVHSKYLVNTNHITSIKKNKRWGINLNGISIPIARARLKGLKQILLFLIFITTFFNTVIAQDCPPLNNAIHLDGVDDHVTLPGSGDAGDGTIEFWFYKDNSEPAGDLYAYKFDNASNVWWKVRFGSNSQLLLFDGFSQVLSYTAPSDFNGWHHFAFTHESASNFSKLYIDGIEVASTNSISVLYGFIRFGGFNADPFKGKIDEIRVWDDVRTQLEIASGMYCDPPYSETELLASIPFNVGIAELDNTSIAFAPNQSTSALASEYPQATFHNLSMNGVESNLVSDFQHDSTSVTAVPLQQSVEIGSPVLYQSTLITQLQCFDNEDLIIQWFKDGQLIESESELNFSIPNASFADAGQYQVLVCNNNRTYSSEVLTLKVRPINSSANNAMSFDGFDDLVFYDNGPNLANGSFTVEFLAKSDAAHAKYALTLGDQAISNQSLHFGWHDANTLRFAFWNNDLDANIQIENTYNHYAFTYDINTGARHIYVNGVSMATNISGSPFVGNNNLFVGGSPLVSRFEGELDEVRIWNVAKTQQEIMDQKDCLASPEADNLVFYTRFDEGEAGGNNTSINTLEDLVNPSNAGFIQNMSLTGGQSNFILGSSISDPAFITKHLKDTLILPDEQLILMVEMSNSCAARTYVWKKNNVIISGETGSMLTINNAELSDDGIYKVEISDAGGVVNESSAIVNVFNPGIEASDGISDYYVDLFWNFDPIPCLVDSDSNAYNEVTARILKDNQEIDFVTFDESQVHNAVINNLPIEGTYRDFTGPNQTNQYSIQLYYGAFGQIEPECGLYSDAGNSLPVQEPDLFSVSNNLLDRIILQWRNNSDLATSYRVLRDGAVIATILSNISKGAVLTYEDSYRHDENNSIESGRPYQYSIEMVSLHINQQWTYPIGTGQTIDKSFTASDNQFNNRVQLNWANVATDDIDKIEIWRADTRHAVLGTSPITYTDTKPAVGDSLEYELRLMRNDTVLALYSDRGSIAGHGTISGFVVNEEGLFPISNVQVTISRKSNGKDYTTPTNEAGAFLFENLPYGLLDSFSISAELIGHNFSYPVKVFPMSAFVHAHDGAIVLDDTEFDQGTADHNIQSFVAMPEVNQDRVSLSWNVNTNADDVLVDVISNGRILFRSTSMDHLMHNLVDREGVPGDETEYQLRIYNIENGAVSSTDQEVILIFPEVSNILPESFLASKEESPTGLTGNVALEWTPVSDNIDTYRIYRNGELIIELPSIASNFIDKTAPFSTDLEYAITSTRYVNGITFESKVPTLANPATINVGILPPIVNLQVIQDGNLPHIGLHWQQPNAVANGLEITGYNVYRNDVLVSQVYHGFPTVFDDKTGVGLQNILYEISTFKTLPDGQMLESDRVSGSNNFPAFANLILSSNGVNHSEGFVELNWNATFHSNFGGYILYLNGDEIERFQPHQLNYRSAAPRGIPLNYELKYYHILHGQTYITSESNVIATQINILGGTVLAPTNFSATNDLPNMVRLNWDYLDFVKSSFNIYRDNVLIANAPVGTREFFDFEAPANKKDIVYKLQAENQGMFSDWVGATGDVDYPVLVYGRVRDASSNVGFAGTQIYTRINGISSLQTISDTSGYFEFPLNNEVQNQSIEIYGLIYSLFHPLNTQVIPINGNSTIQVNFDFNNPAPIDDSPLSKITYANVNFDPFTLHGHIHFQNSNEHFDGVEIRRGFTIIGHQSKSDGNIFIDTTAVPGIDYSYLLRTFKETPEGIKYSDYYRFETQYPKLESVDYLSGQALENENSILVQWSHKYNHMDGFIILKNKELLATVSANEPFRLEDQDGVPGEDYEYEVIAYKRIEGIVYQSEAKNVVVRFPTIAPVSNLLGENPFIPNVNINGTETDPQYELNHVKLSWTYPTGDADNFKILRDGEILETIEGDLRTYKDYQGEPGLTYEYSVSVLTDDNGKMNESERKDVSVLFPAVSKVYNASVASNDLIGTNKLTWAYYGRVDIQFEIYANGELLNIVNRDIETENSETFEFSDLESAPTTNAINYEIIAVKEINDGQKFSALPTTITALGYPDIPQLEVNATDGVYDAAVNIEWEVSFDAAISYFKIQKRKTADLNEVTILADNISRLDRQFLDVIDLSSDRVQYEYNVIACRVFDGGATICRNDWLDIDVGQPSNPNDANPMVGTGNTTVFAVDQNSYLIHPQPGSIRRYTEQPDGSIQISGSEFDNLLSVGYGDIDLSGNLVVVGIPNHVESQGANQRRVGKISIKNRDVMDGFGGFTTEAEFTGDFNNAFGDDLGGVVAMSDELVVANRNGNGILGISAFHKNQNGNWEQITINAQTSQINMDYNWNLGPVTSIDVEGGLAVIGMPTSQRNGLPSNVGACMVLEYSEGSNSLNFKAMLADALETGTIETGLGSIVSVSDNLFAVKSTSKVSIFGDVGGSITKIDDIFPPQDNTTNFGTGLMLTKNYLAISQTSNINDGGRIFMYGKQPGTNNLILSQSPLPDHIFYRKEIDDFTHERYADGFAGAVGVGTESLFAKSNDSVYLFKLNHPFLHSFSATDGTSSETQLTWQTHCVGCPSDYVNQINVYRDSELIAILPGSENTFNDSETNILVNASAPVKGKIHLYEIEGVSIDNFTTSKVADVGRSKNPGEITGFVNIIGTQIGVPGVLVMATGTHISGQKYEYTDVTGFDGGFSLENVFVGGPGMSYTMSGEYLDHTIVPIGNGEVILTEANPTKDFVLLQDETAFVIRGSVNRNNTLCKLDDIEVKYYHTVNGVEMLVDSVLTEDGVYSLTVYPNTPNIESMRLSIDNAQFVETTPGVVDTIQYHFVADGPQVLADFTDFPLVQQLNFTDELTYTVPIRVVNTCGDPVADQPIRIRIGSFDGCIQQDVLTDDDGIVNVALYPKNYIIAVEGIAGAGVNNYENAAVDYLKLRPEYLEIYDLHIAAGGNELPAISPIHFIYHRAVTITSNQTFDRFLCDDFQQAPILEQGELYEMSFNLLEHHQFGQVCLANDGYLVVRNSAANDSKPDTLQISNGLSGSHLFVAGIPNLIDPFTLNISLQYFSDGGRLLGSKGIPVIVEGNKPLPGTGVQVAAATEGGELKLPAFILRDPPGDGSFATLEEGNTIEKSIEIEREVGGSLGFTGDFFHTVASIGGFWQAEIGGGRSTSKGFAWDFSVSTTQSYSTSDSGEPEGVGRVADVVVGGGVATQYGLTQAVTFVDNCTPVRNTRIAFSLSNFNTTFAYTIGFMENLVEKYERDSLLIAQGLLSYINADGTVLDPAFAIEQAIALKNSWQKMIRYHDVETVPHYVLCNDRKYQTQLSTDAAAGYDQWRNAFCTQIGSYAGDDFILNNDIEWTQDLINAYNNTVAYTDAIRKLPPDVPFPGGLVMTQGRINALSSAISNEFHETMGANVKSAEVHDISGNVVFEKSVSSQQTSSTNYSTSSFFAMDIAAGVAINIESDVGVGKEEEILENETTLGLRMTNEVTLSTDKAVALTNESNISYTVFDDDPEDQVSFVVLQAPIQGQTPYFIRLGGISSCPPEHALTPNSDNAPLLIDDPYITTIIDPVSGAASTNPPPKHNVPAGEAAIFQVQLSNQAFTGYDRQQRVFLDLNSNPNGAIIKIGGSNLNLVSPIYTLPPGGSVIQSLTVERPNGTPFYSFENIRIGIEPACDETGENEEAKYIELDVYFESPCSPVSLTQPIDGFVVNRINPNVENDREIIPFELRDYQSDNENLVHIQLQYRRLGTGENWKNVPGGIINRAQLADQDAGLANGQDPLYFFEWDITGFYNLYPDGEYLVRAQAFCGLEGIQYSNEISGTIDRSDLKLTGIPEPSDGVWTIGDEISATFSTDIDCGVITSTDSVGQYLELFDLATMTSVPFEFVCQNNKLTIVPTEAMTTFDGKKLRVIYRDIRNISGNVSSPIVWDFDVITQPVDWIENMIEVFLYEGEIKTIATSIMNTTQNPVTGLSIIGAPSWLQVDPAGSFTAGSSGQEVLLTFDGSNLSAGSYMANLLINITGRQPSLPIMLHVLKEPPTPNLVGVFTDSMDLVINWSFVEPFALSNDVLDQIQVYKNGIFRGAAFIEEKGGHYSASVKVYGNTTDENELLEFVIWNADEAQAYTPINNTNIPFQSNTSRGISTNPEVLLVENDLFTFRKIIYVDSSNVVGPHDGLTWETAFNYLEDGIANAIAEDTIWVAKGTYYPSQFGARGKSFEIDVPLAILGGFMSGMTSPGQRTGHDETLLSGNIGSTMDDIDNSYRVVISSAEHVLLNGLKIGHGYANGGNDNDKGACLYNAGILQIDNCALEDGTALQGGGLIYNSGMLSIKNSQFSIDIGSNTAALLNDSGAIITIETDVDFIERN